VLHEWLRYNGVEIANALRTEAYVASFGLPAFKGCSECPSVFDALRHEWTYGDVARDYLSYQEVLDRYSDYADLRGGASGEPYSSPQQDRAPWYDVDNADTWGFLGFYVLEVVGLDDSTRTATVTERVADGASVGRIRAKSRSIYVRGLLVGLDDASVQAGMSWLESVTSPPFCNPLPACVGPTLEFFAACPVTCASAPDCYDDCAAPYRRQVFDAYVVDGPRVIEKYTPTEGVMWEVEFTVVAGNPWVYGSSVVIYDPDNQHVGPSYGPFDSAEFGTDFDQGVPRPPLNPTPTVTQVARGAPLVAGVPAVSSATSCLTDPACPPTPAFPGAPQSVGVGCRPEHTGQWRRKTFVVRAEQVPQWAVAVPVLTLELPASSQGLRDITVSFYQRPFVAPASQMRVSWLAGGAQLQLDGARDQIMLDCGGDVVRAEHAVSTPTTPGQFRWPLVSCGDEWMMTVEVPDTVSAADFDALKVTALLRVRHL
jgi:hypothetical protein